MEACSVCACDEKDLPFEWAQSTSDTETSNPSDMQRFDFGWISSESNMDPLQNLEEVKITKLDDWGKQRGKFQ